MRATRDNSAVHTSLDAITNATKNNENVMPLIIEAAQSYATMGEIVDSMKVVFGEWEETSVL